MSELKTTPGPWYRYTRESRTICADVTRGGICFLERIVSVRATPEAEANVSLIAASPDLYEALSICLEIAEKPLKRAMNLAGRSPYEIGIAALRKARGETPKVSR